MLKDKNTPIFIISHKFYRGYESYIEYYIKNINKYYTGALIIVVDNNSTHVKDIFTNLIGFKNVVLLDNNIDCKFEIGAYKVALKHIIDNNLLNNHSYIVLTQDTFILKNKIDFNLLHEQNITAAPINSFKMDNIFKDIRDEILIKMDLFNNLDKITFCWCSSFIIATNKAQQLFNYFKDIIITTRDESGASERYLARILWELNDYKNNDIDGDMAALKYSWDGKINPSPKYDCHNVNVYDEKITTYFVKKTQQKTEKTCDR